MCMLDTLREDNRREEALSWHNRTHPDPLDYWGECSLCEEFIEGDIEMGLRCRHGRYIPFVTDERGSVITDMECDLGCQVDYGPAFYTDWKQILEQEISYLDRLSKELHPC